MTPPRTLVPAVGTRRRLEALLWMGWPHHELSRRVGVDTVDHVCRARISVERWAADAVRRVYDDLSHRPGPSTRTRSLAAAAGYAPPAAWDDDTIDDPDTIPSGVRRHTGTRLHVDDIAFLAAWGMSTADIADRLAVTRDAIGTCIRRAAEVPETAATAAQVRARLDVNNDVQRVAQGDPRQQQRCAA